MNRDLTPTDLTTAIQGDLDAFRLVREQRHESLRECRARLPSSLSERSGLSVPAVVIQWWYE